MSALTGRLAAAGGSVVLVSGETEESPRVCVRVLVLRDGRLARAFDAPGIRAEDPVAACL